MTRLNRREMMIFSGSSLLLAAAGASSQDRRSPSASQPQDQRSYTIHAGCLLEMAADTPVAGSGSVQSTPRGARVTRDRYLLIREGRIEAIRSKPFRESLPHLDLSRELVMPGFISGHTHCCSATPTRGIIEAPRSYRRPLELVEQLSDDEMDALTAFNLAELIRSGCTTQVEMSLSLRQAESYVRIAKQFGARGFPGAMIPDMTRLFPIWFRGADEVLWESEEGTLKEIEANLRFGQTHRNASGGLLQPMMSPHACDTHTPKTLAAVAAAAKELGTGVHIHLSQGQRETDTVRRLWGKTPTQWLEELGILESGPVFGAHMSGLDWEVDPPILNRHGVVYAHCPSGGGAGNGTQPYPEALAAGMAVNVAIDTHSNDFVENLKLAVLYGQARHELLTDLAGGSVKSRAPSIGDAVDGATVIPADGLRRPDLGRIEEGAAADLISMDVSGMLVGSGSLPPEPLNNLLYANGRMVSTVMTAGRVQVANGEFMAGDAGSIVKAGGEVAQKIWRQLDGEGWFEEGKRLCSSIVG